MRPIRDHALRSLGLLALLSVVPLLGCGSGGVVLRSHQDNDGNGVASSGDVYTNAYTGCVDSPLGNREDGTIVLSLNSFGGAPGGVWNLSTVVTVSMQIQGLLGLSTFNGGLDLTANQDAAGVLRMTLSMMNFTKQGPIHRLTILSASVSYTRDTNTGAYTLISSATLDSTRLGGIITFATSPLGMTGQRGQFPSQGMMVVHGTNNSTMRITAIDRFTAQVDIDADGDFVYETSEVRQWIHLVH